MSPYINVGAASDITPEAGHVALVMANGRRVALCNVGGELYAIDDVCTHDGAPLDQGELDGAAIECPRHGARFDVRTGLVVALPAVMPVRTYPVRVQNGAIEIEIE